jgi:hypothetical protein
MLESTSATFVSTIESVDQLSPTTVAKSWVSLVTLGALTVSIILALLWSHRTDHSMKKIVPLEEEQTKQQRIGKSVRRRNKVSSSSSLIVNAELDIVDQSLPNALSSRSFTCRCWEEMKHHHRWLCILFHYSEDFPRVLRVASLATNMIVMLFMQSLTYNLTNPDDGTCRMYKDRADCLGPRSPYATGEAKCEWVVSIEECEFIQPGSQVKVVLFVAIVCAIVTTPIALFVDWIILNVIAAPMKQSDLSLVSAFEAIVPLEGGVGGGGVVVSRGSSSALPSPHHHHDGGGRTWASSLFDSSEHGRRPICDASAVIASFHQLSSELRRHREEELSEGSVRAEFDCK